MPEYKIKVFTLRQYDSPNLDQLKGEVLKKDSPLKSVEIDTDKNPAEMVIFTNNILPGVAAALVTMCHALPGYFDAEIVRLKK